MRTGLLPVVFSCRELRLSDGELMLVMVPQPRYAKIAARQFIIGEEYPLVILETRSRSSHNQYFAAVQDGFDNMPESVGAIAKRLGLSPPPPAGFISADHLRKWCLCETGWCDVGEFDFDDRTAAERLAKFYRRNDEYAQITVRGSHITIKTAKSQSAAAMAKEPFEQSKRAVLDLIESMLSVKRGELKRNAGKSA